MGLPVTTAERPFPGSPNPHAPGDPLLALSGVWRFWGRRKKRWAVLRDIDLDVAAGTATCITGRNGAGKTTLLRIASGILAPNHGTVAVGGIGPTDSWREYHRKIGFLSAGDRALYARVSVRGHLMHWTALALIPAREREQIVDQALERFGLADLAKRRADRLSQGQRQRLRLALAVVHKPKLLLLDEPRNSLDAEGQEILYGVVRDILREGGAVICCGPSGDNQLDQFDRTAVIEDGRLRFE